MYFDFSLFNRFFNNLDITNFCYFTHTIVAKYHCTKKKKNCNALFLALICLFCLTFHHSI
ncbi:hypothetical protein RchiOBHm_Chr7g0194581 [Rosa chinensis]|uniref:Uncharacterized protein n=1 Tax=Rosa chinensis TaxID=74649 RepID=A0A2P6P641_ROSCH|nr:hypothetical protein RchiOBHm_Chr7g0194581 [Rosa chinensis]